MDFSKRYNREAFIAFLRDKFLPEDFVAETKNVTLTTQTKYTQSVVKLGHCPTLDLVVYEVRHTSHHDARVGLSREAFRLLADELQDKALVAFVPDDTDKNYRLSLIEITLGIDDNGKLTHAFSNPRRSSFLLGEGIATYTPNKYLNEKGRIVNDEDLRSRFSVEVLTKEFYSELSDWYAWAIKIIHFPNDLNTTADDQKYNHEGTIRLITRLIFVWFLKQRGLIPWQFFDEDFIREHLLENFNPNDVNGLFDFKSNESRYYKAILQNLFFAMLNCPICSEGSNEPTERRFKDGRNGYDDNKRMRYRFFFKDPDLFLRLANETVPFLNGGLFDCLDDKPHDIYYDGFSERKASMEQLGVPDFLFFGEEAGKNIDLSEFYGDKNKRKVSARGIIDILKRYNFTVEENMPFDKDVSLDPELLGKVFENLLAAYVPETRDIVRKNTGSFYTPRDIVQYMVDESLVAHLKRTVGDSLEAEYRKLLSYTDEEPNLTNEQRTKIMQSLYRCKILDPACGSGAFPVGILQQMVHILTQIDPDNSRWKEMLMEQAISDTSEAYRTASDEERAEMVADIERSFDESVNRPDYARKLYLIENCIFGVDIQAIAIQISKLRFFISLVVDQKINNRPEDNFGIRPLPNLEAKFVAANTLIGLKKAEANLFDSEEIKRKEKDMKTAKHRIFSARTSKTKRKYRDQVSTLRQEIADLLVANNMIGNEQAQELAQWDMFDQNASSPFFDPEWMFGVKDGFDIIIGNPPYNELRDLTEIEQTVYKKSNYYDYAKGGRVNMFQFFYPFAIQNVVENGCCCLITQNSILAESSAYNNRQYIFNECSIIKIDSFPERDNVKLRVFESAKMSVCICLLRKHKQSDFSFDIRVWKDKYMNICAYNQLNKSDILRIYPEEMIVPICSKENWLLINKIKSCGNYNIVAQAGEIDMTKYKHLFSDSPQLQRVITGAQVQRYHITDTPSQGKVVYLPKDLPLSQSRKNDINEKRIVMQRITGVDSKIRIIATMIPKDNYCANSTNYISPTSNAINIFYLLAIVNSKCINFYFKQTSTNTNVTGREISKLPILIGNKALEEKLAKNAISIIENISNSKDVIKEEQEIDRLVYKLYGLTYAEVKTVDPETPITEEEYNKE